MTEYKHPGLLHSSVDLQRMKELVSRKTEPVYSGYLKLMENRHAGLGQKPSAVPIIYRGAHTEENYSVLYKDAATAYDSALMWHITSNLQYADQAVIFLNAWGEKLNEISLNSPDGALAAGIYGFQLANAAELMRDYSGWENDNFNHFKEMMLSVFYKVNHDFLTTHLDNSYTTFWANWDACNLSSMLAIGILTDSQDIVNEAIDYFKNGKGMGSIENMVWHVYDGDNSGLAQLQESGRDQGHALLDIALMETVCQMAWNQGVDLFGYDDNRFMKGAEYAAKYNLGYDVPFLEYNNGSYINKVISPTARGDLRPIWEMLYSHYGIIKGLNIPYIKEFAERVRPEGGGGDYSPNSGGYDSLGFGTLAYYLPF